MRNWDIMSGGIRERVPLTKKWHGSGWKPTLTVPSAWLSGWNYRSPITIEERSGSNLEDYQILIELDYTNFNFEDAQSDGEDIRFTLGDRSTLIDYWIEEWDKTNKSGKIWVEVPLILASETKGIYMYYGNSSASSASNGGNTFEFFHDYESVPDVNGCGVWYTSGGVYHGAMATYCMWHRPMAVYASSQDKTFFVYGNYENSPTISYYDHATGVFADPVVLGTNPDGDAHRNPTILIDEDGYIYVFWGAHVHPTHVTKSKSTYDITSWESKTDIGAHTSYPQPWQLKSGEIFVSYRGDPNMSWCSQKSVDGGESWLDYTNIVDFTTGQIYLVSIAETGSYPRKIHLAWSHMVSTWDQRWDVYYAYSDDGGTTWKKRDGTEYTLPITEASAEKVYESGDEGVWLKDIQLDSNGNPYILFISANRITYQGTWKIARYSGGNWVITDLTSSDHMYDSGALVILADNDMRIYAPTTPSQAGEDGGDIEEWQSTDSGQTWVNTKHITKNSPYSHNHVRTVWNSQKGDFRVFWSYGNSLLNPADKRVHLYYYGEEQSSANTVFVCSSPPVSIVGEKKKHGVSSYKFHDTSGGACVLEMGDVSKEEGIIGFWMRIESIGYFSICAYGEVTSNARVGFKDDGHFRYWDGSNHSTSESYSTRAWYLITIEFDCGVGKYNFVVYDTDMNEVCRVDAISFGDPPPSKLSKFTLYTSAAYIGDAYADAFRFRKYTSPEPLISIPLLSPPPTPPTPSTLQQNMLLVEAGNSLMQENGNYLLLDG